MKITITCEHCGHSISLVPVNIGQHAYMSNINEHFNISGIELDYDYSVDEIEEVTAKVTEIRFDCNSCGDYIVLSL